MYEGKSEVEGRTKGGRACKEETLSAMYERGAEEGGDKGRETSNARDNMSQRGGSLGLKDKRRAVKEEIAWRGGESFASALARLAGGSNRITESSGEGSKEQERKPKPGEGRCESEPPAGGHSAKSSEKVAKSRGILRSLGEKGAVGGGSTSRSRGGEKT